MRMQLNEDIAGTGLSSNTGEVSVILNHFSTQELVEELITREGVEHKRVEPYAPLVAEFLNDSGPCVIIKIVD